MDLPHRLADALQAVRPDHPDPLVALRALYADDLHFRDPIQELHGLPAFLAMNEHLLKRLSQLAWEIRGARGDDSYAMLEWTMRAKPRLGPSMSVDGATVVHARAGRIVDHRDYWDVGEMMASLVPGGLRLLHLLRKPLA